MLYPSISLTFDIGKLCKLIYNINILNNEYSVISNFFNNNYYYETYDIYVLKNTIYQEKNDLKNKKMSDMIKEWVTYHADYSI